MLERRRRYGCKSYPRHMRRWRRASTFPSRSPSHLGVAMRALRCRWVSRANPHSPLQLDGFAARAVPVCGAVDPAGSCPGPCRLHPDQYLMCSGSLRPLKRRQTKATRPASGVPSRPGIKGQCSRIAERRSPLNHSHGRFQDLARAAASSSAAA